jgi:hypothetical protein
MSAPRIAFFVSSHGFGHAARSCAVMEALGARRPGIGLDIFTTTPPWFFAESLSVPFSHHGVQSDIGVLQKNSLEEDLSGTVRELDKFVPFDETEAAALAVRLQQLGVEAVLCDIAPLGIHVAHRAGVPAILIENFTWDWIYAGYLDREDGFGPAMEYLSGCFGEADYHIQTRPACAPGNVDLVVSPVSRQPRLSSPVIRKRLGLSGADTLVLITMGGIPENHEFLGHLKTIRDVTFILPGIATEAHRDGNLIRLPHHSEFYHPDLVGACSAVIGKLGYSTLAEAYHAGIPFGYVMRPRFRETESLAAFADQHLPSVRISDTDFRAGRWTGCLAELLTRPAISGERSNGAERVAEFVLNVLTYRKSKNQMRK